MTIPTQESISKTNSTFYNIAKWILVIPVALVIPAFLLGLNYYFFGRLEFYQWTMPFGLGALFVIVGVIFAPNHKDIVNLALLGLSSVAAGTYFHYLNISFGSTLPALYLIRSFGVLLGGIIGSIMTFKDNIYTERNEPAFRWFHIIRWILVLPVSFLCFIVVIELAHLLFGRYTIGSDIIKNSLAIYFVVKIGATIAPKYHLYTGAVLYSLFLFVASGGWVSTVLRAYPDYPLILLLGVIVIILIMTSGIISCNKIKTKYEYTTELST